MEVGPGTLGTWVNTIGGEKVVPLINLMHETLLAVVFIHIDETPLQVLRSDKAVGADHYIVARAGGPPGRGGTAHHLVRLHCIAYHRRFEAAVGGSGWTVPR